MDKQPVGQLPDLTQSNNDDEIMVITNSEYNQLKKEKISDFITDLTSTDENNAIVKGTDGKLFTKNFGNAANITEGTLPVSVLPDIPKNKLPEIEIDDLPDSGITAGTYTYPTDIVINSKGQVTSITEGQAGANNANQDLSNLGPLGLDKINQSKALETGSVSSDADVYADVLKYKNSGTGTGIDTIKPDDYEVVGSPVITDDGVVSNVQSGVSISTPEAYSLVSNFTIVSPTIAVNSFVDNAAIGFCKWGSNFNLSFGSDLYVWSILFVNKDGTKTLEQAKISNFSLELKKKYVVKFEQVYKDSKYIRTLKVYDSEDLLNPIGVNTYESIYPIYGDTDTNKINIIYATTTDRDANFDLNTCKFYQNGNLVYQPCLKIPYTQSKTGSKIVDAAYRDRVQDVYEQYGVAMYYTLDEENENFSLPMGEIYGMIEKKNEELNNPFSLFDSKYSETLLYNASWLLSNGTYYAKSVYVTAYEALVVENNSEIEAGTSVQLPSGTTYVKRGLSVKLSTTEDITDYDFVINAANETFRLPIKVKLASGKAVVGDGNPLGLLVGTEEDYLYNNYDAGISRLEARTINGVASGILQFASVNPDPTKSGIETSNSGLYLYFYVGETVQNAHLIDAAQIAGNIADKANADLSNCTKPYVTETYVNGTSWYRLWSDGWCEQGGYNSNTGTYTVTMMKEFADTNYTLLTQYAETTNGTNPVTPNELSTWNKTTSSFTTYSDFAGKIWLAFGYVA